MKKKKSTKFRAIDLAIILLCLTGSFASGSAFWNEYNRTLTKLNEDPVGTIVFKKRTAQRKFIDRVVWDRLSQKSSVYNGDTIRTIEFSEAVITFRNEVTHITLFENTMVQIYYNDIDGVKIDFSGGNIGVISGSANVVVASSSSEITVDGQMNLSKNDQGSALSVLEGSVNLNGETMQAGEMLVLDENNEIVLIPAISIISFGSSMRVYSSPEGIAPVVFSWYESNFNPDTYVIIEVTLDGAFNRVVEKAEARGINTVSFNIKNGNYWWRAYTAASGSSEPVSALYPSGTLEVIPFVEYVPVVAVAYHEPEPELPPAVEPARPPEPQQNARVTQPAAEPEQQQVDIPIISNEARWQPSYSGASFSRVSISNEFITNRNVDVLTINIVGLQGMERWAGGMLYNQNIIQRLKRNSGIKFKVLGDGNEDWVITLVADDGSRYFPPMTSNKDQINQIDIPYSRFRQQEGQTPQRFNIEKLNGLHIEQRRTGLHAAELQSTIIKIFDFEVDARQQSASQSVSQPASQPAPQATIEPNTPVAAMTRPARFTGAANEMPVLFYIGGWTSHLNAGNRNDLLNLHASIQVVDEQMQGQLKDVIAYTVVLGESNNWRSGTFRLNSDIVLSKFREGSGIKFKALINGRSGWRINFITEDSDDPYQVRISARAERFTDVNIPYSSLRRGFNKDKLIAIEVQRYSSGESEIGTSTLRIFDFEIY